jgi:rRNA small subunit pseudouridine methyltransferase Nep1
MKTEVRLPRTPLERDLTPRVIVVLDKAPLEIAKLGQHYQLLCSEEHAGLLKKRLSGGRNAATTAADYRPDIVHQCLLTLLDSPLSRAGRLQVFIRTTKNVLIEVNPKTRIPRTYRRFAGLMVQLLHKLSVRAMLSSGGEGNGEKLMNVIKNPLVDHLPTTCHRIGLSGDAGRVVNLRQYLATELFHCQSDDVRAEVPAAKELKASSPREREQRELPVVLWLGAMSHGRDDFAEAELSVSLSQYPLSASVVCGKICCAFEEHYGIL